jgi:hypothetical protein
MPSDTAPFAQDSRLLCAILAAQAAALRERIAGSVMFERLMRCADLLATLASQLPPGSEPSAAAAQLGQALDELAFYDAQQQDWARQTADLVAGALKLLGTAEEDPQQTLSLTRLLGLYVSDDQRQLHAAVLAERTAGQGTDRSGA